MSFLNTYARYPIELCRGQGVRLQDVQGRWYLDGIAGIAVMALGHGHPRVLAAVHAQVDRLMHVSNLYHVDIQRQFADALSGLYAWPSGPAALFLSNSGVEAVEGAVKLARKWHYRRGQPRAEIITAMGAFHGRTLMALAMTPKPKYQEGYGPLPSEVRNLDAAQIPAAIGDRTAAVFVEPIQGEGGCLPIENLAEIRAACDAAGALLVYDEIQSGLGRAGHLRFEPLPDVVTLAKALGGGLPLGAIVASPEVATAFQPGDHGSTFGGNPVACAAGLATLQTIQEEGLIASNVVLGARLRAGLEAAGARVTGEGLILGAWTELPASAVVDAMRDRGVLVCPAGDRAVRFLPPYIISPAEVDELVEAYTLALADVRASR